MKGTTFLAIDVELTEVADFHSTTHRMWNDEKKLAWNCEKKLRENQR